MRTSAPLQRFPLRRRRRGVSNVIAAVLLVAITITAGTFLWTLSFNFPAPTTYVTYVAHAGLKVPAWGDPTDCVPVGYPITGKSTWNATELTAAAKDCSGSPPIGNFSVMNATEITFTSVSPVNLQLQDIEFQFICHNSTNTSVLVGGSLAAMTWFPGATTSPAPNAPHLEWCASFHAGGFGGGAFGTLYNRLGLFVPIQQNVNVLEPGDTFILYVHTPDSIYDPSCGAHGGPDCDDYHGAPPWCFTTPGSCEIKITSTSGQGQLLADIQVYSISGANE
jgi:flagellin-like protein